MTSRTQPQPPLREQSAYADEGQGVETMVVPSKTLPQPLDGEGRSKQAKADFGSLRATFLPFYICYAPMRLHHVPEMIQKELELGSSALSVLAKCRSEFHMQPAEKEVETCIAKDVRTRLYCFYAYYNWDMMNSVDELCKKYFGMEKDLWLELEIKYGPEVPPYKLLTGDTPAEIKVRKEREQMKGTSSRQPPKQPLAIFDMTESAPSQPSQPKVQQPFDETEGLRKVLLSSGIDMNRIWRKPHAAQQSSLRMNPEDFQLL
jgi:hypothetical protein